MGPLKKKLAPNPESPEDPGTNFVAQATGRGEPFRAVFPTTTAKNLPSTTTSLLFAFSPSPIMQCVNQLLKDFVIVNNNGHILWRHYSADQRHTGPFINGQSE